MTSVSGQVGALDAASNARRFWNEAVVAKGGRDALDAIRTIHVSSHAGKDEFLVVYPNKTWEWQDRRPSVFGMEMTMYNGDTGLHYTGQLGQRAVELTAIEAIDPVERRFSALSWLTLENSWYKPVPEIYRLEKVGGKKVDVVRTSLGTQRIEFAFDRTSHLAVKVSYFTLDPTSREYTFLYELRLSDYVNFEGLMVPRLVNGVPYEYDFNIEYNEDVFLSAPLPVEKSQDAWRRGRR
jgi:hypothetical protein